MEEGGREIELNPLGDEDPIDEDPIDEETDFGGGEESFRFRHFNTTIEDDDIKTPLLGKLKREIREDLKKSIIQK